MQPTESRPVALVTGGSRGIGRAVVEALLEEGWIVAFSSRRPESVEKALAQLAPVHGDAVEGRAVDVRDQPAVDAWIEGVAERRGHIDCLVNNAGLGRFAPVGDLSGDQWREVLHTNLDGAFYCLRAVTGPMKRQGSGWIFNIASLAGKNPFAGGAAYNASKFGMIGLSDAAMLDLRPHGIRVTAILPGSVATDFAQRDDDSWMIRPEDIAQMILDLLRFPPRTLPSRVEMRPTQPPSSS